MKISPMLALPMARSTSPRHSPAPTLLAPAFDPQLTAVAALRRLAQRPQTPVPNSHALGLMGGATGLHAAGVGFLDDAICPICGHPCKIDDPSVTHSGPHICDNGHRWGA